MRTFKLEEYLGKCEFTAPYLLCCSDAESFSLAEILEMAALEDLALWEKLRLGYTEVKGLPILREALVQNLYPALKSDDVLCFSGAEEGIFCALHTLCDLGDHVIVLTPCYQSLIEIPLAKGCDVTALPLKEENQWRISVDEIKSAIKANTKCVVMNFPHNPTGQVITQDELHELIALLERHGIWLFSDEVYRLLGSPSEPWASPAACIYPRALSLGVMSKAFGMAGLRVGWIACQDRELLERIERFKHYTTICNSAPSKILSLITLNNKDQILARNNQIVAENLAILDIFFTERTDTFSWVKPQGGCVGFVDYKKAESIDAFCARLVEKQGVLLMPASLYDVSSNHFRVGFGRKNMAASLEQLKMFLER